jgi:lipopolysaccharide export LptBFGC system permease protein LptF
VYAADGTGWKSMAIGATATIAYIAFYTSISPSRYWSPASLMPPFAMAWIPNVALVLLTIKLFLRSRGPGVARRCRGS